MNILTGNFNTMSGFQGYPPSTTPNYGPYPPQDPGPSMGYAMPPGSQAGQAPQGYPPTNSQPSSQFTIPKQPMPQGMYTPPQPLMSYPPFPPGQVPHQPFYPPSHIPPNMDPYPASSYLGSNQPVQSGPPPNLNPYPENFQSKPFPGSNQPMNPGHLPQMEYPSHSIQPNLNPQVPFNPYTNATQFNHTANSGPPPHPNLYTESMPALYPGTNQVIPSGPLVHPNYIAAQAPPNQSSNTPYLNAYPTGSLPQMGYSAPHVPTTGPYPDGNFCVPLPNAPLYEQIPKEFQEQNQELPKQMQLSSELPPATELPPQNTNLATQIEVQTIVTAAATEMANQMYPSLSAENNGPLVEEDDNQKEGYLAVDNNVPEVQASGNELAEPLAAMAITAIAVVAVEQKAEGQLQETTSGNGPSKEHCSNAAAAEHSDSVNHYYGTVKPYHPFDPKKDAEQLRKTVKGFGTDEELIVKILANRTLSQRKEIAQVYSETFKKEIVKDLKSELSGNLKETVRALMMPRVRYLTKCLRAALIGRTTLQRLLVEIYFTSTNAEIQEINEIYMKEFKASLDKDLRREVPGYFRQIINAVNRSTRDESPHIDKAKVLADAKALCHSQIGCWGHVKSVFTELLILRSFAHLRQVFHEYRKMSKYTVQDILKKEMSASLLEGMLLIIECIENRITFFAHLLNNAIKTLKNDDAAVIRIIATRSEIDLQLIKDAYLKLYKKPLGKQIHSVTDGDYRKSLLQILHTD